MCLWRKESLGNIWKRSFQRTHDNGYGGKKYYGYQIGRRQSQVGFAAIGGVGPNAACHIVGIEQRGKLAAVMPRRMRDGEAADEAMCAVARSAEIARRDALPAGAQMT
jgi:hypothetical protein